MLCDPQSCPHADSMVAKVEVLVSVLFVLVARQEIMESWLVVRDHSCESACRITPEDPANHKMAGGSSRTTRQLLQHEQHLASSLRRLSSELLDRGD